VARGVARGATVNSLISPDFPMIVWPAWVANKRCRINQSSGARRGARSSHPRMNQSPCTSTNIMPTAVVLAAGRVPPYHVAPASYREITGKHVLVLNYIYKKKSDPLKLINF
jgi:hypothetical protein